MSTKNSNDMERAHNIVNTLGGLKEVVVKRIKKEKGLIEQSEDNNTVILEEDNRQLFLD